MVANSLSLGVLLELLPLVPLESLRLVRPFYKLFMKTPSCRSSNCTISRTFLPIAGSYASPETSMNEVPQHLESPQPVMSKALAEHKQVFDNEKTLKFVYIRENLRLSVYLSELIDFCFLVHLVVFDHQSVGAAHLQPWDLEMNFVRTQC